ncbi:MAG: type I-PGING CRISPR-associated protein Cas5p [Bacteroidaceae bacterium]|nr:type I-PGING CRISPR-associated protein Cas5p [Bacteroidaceae bacterium]
MKNIDISILREEPLKDVKAKLIIEPLAPLSMVSDLPGSYYKSRTTPSKKMVCGLIENIMGWHFSIDTRKNIIEQIKINSGEKQKNHQSGSTYIPLLMDYFEIEREPFLKFDSVCFYDDLWIRSHSRRDSASKHIKACRHYDLQWKNAVDAILNKKDIIKSEKTKELKEVDERYINRSPLFYPIPTKREYVFMENGVYIYDMLFDKKLFIAFKKSLEQYNIAYLGNSEGWVNIILEYR